AYCQYRSYRDEWYSVTWQECAEQALRYQTALLNSDLQAGDRVALMLRNSVEWVFFDQAALGLGLVTVPIFSEDSAGNCLHILQDAEVRLLFLANDNQWNRVAKELDTIPSLQIVISLEELHLKGSDTPLKAKPVHLDQWLPPLQTSNKDAVACLSQNDCATQDSLATLMYTSGTTGKPKGVMLTHKNILSNIYALEQMFDFREDDRFLSFLPLSHIFERVCGYYLAQRIGASVFYVRSITTLMQDMMMHRPTVLLSVPRIYERINMRLRKKFNKPVLKNFFASCIYVGLQYQQAKGLAKIIWFIPWLISDGLLGRKVRKVFGGQLRCAISGGAAISSQVSNTFLACAVPLYQGYGLTETAPVIAVNRPKSNIASSVGCPLPSVEVRMTEEGELLTRSSCVMQGYWKLPQATAKIIDDDGWLHTGDIVRMNANGHIFITGRKKEIIVMSNGEKIPPVDIEMAIMEDPRIAQVMIYGEGQAFLIALLVPDRELLEAQNIAPEQAQALFKKILAKCMTNFPGYARIRSIVIVDEPWSIENGMLTPTLKVKRTQIVKQYQAQINQAYQKLAV
ncbi:MAG: AMP-dependent synthetase/ligase, partial [Candidatus Oxydemutatoraceae bacterium WSBS_2016_MAG_OTU14]